MTSSLLAAAEAAAAEAAEAEAAKRARVRADRLDDLRERTVRLLSRILEDVVLENVLGLDDVVATWEPIDTSHVGAAPSGLIGELDGVPLGTTRDGRFATQLHAARWVEVDGIRFPVMSQPIDTLAALPVALEQLDRIAAEEEAAIRNDTGRDNDPPPEEYLADAIRRADIPGLLTVAEHDLATASQLVAPIVIAAQLEEIADRIHALTPDRS